MTIYSVYLPPAETGTLFSDQFRLVPDKKSPWALIVPLLWLVYHRLWLVLLAYLVVIGAISLFFAWNQHVAIAYLSGLPGLYFLLEGQELVSGKLEREGWQFVGVVEAANKEEAEIRYLAGNEQVTFEQPATPSHPLSITRKFTSKNQGLFPE